MKKNLPGFGGPIFKAVTPNISKKNNHLNFLTRHIMLINSMLAAVQNWKKTIAIVLFTCCSFFSSNLLAQTWTSTGAGGNWNTPGTWDQGTVPPAGNPVVIASGSPVTINAAITNGARTATTTINSSATLTISSAVTFADLAGSGSISASGTTTITIGNSYTGATAIYSGNITQSGGTVSLTKTGTGTIALTGTASTYSGATTISSGILLISNDRALGADPGSASATNITLSGGTLSASASFTLATNRGITLTSSTSSSIDVATGQTLTYGGAITSSGSLSKTSTGTLTLSGASNYTGTTTISAGVIKLGNASALGTTAGNTTVSGGATLDINGTNYSTAEPITINGTGFNGAGAITNSSGSDGTFAGPITLGSASSIIASSGKVILSSGTAVGGTGLALTLDGTNTSGSVFSTAAIGTGTGGTLIKNGTGTWTLGTTPSTYTGTTTINAGILKINVASPFPSTNTILINAGTLDLNGKSMPIASITGTGTVTNSSGTAVTLTIGGDNSNSTFAGTINNSNGIAITKSGTGTLTLSGNNTYTGVTTVSVGTLKLGSNNALSPNTSSITVSNNAALDLFGAICSTNKTLTINGTGISSGGALLNSSSTAASYPGPVVLASASSIIGGTGTITLSSGTAISGTFNLTLGGAVGGTITSKISTSTANLIKQDAGTWSLTNNASTYTGTTTISQGTLSIVLINNTSSASSLGTPADAAHGTIAMGAGAVLQYLGGTTATNRIINLNGTAGSASTIDASGTGPITFTSATTGTSGNSLILTGSSVGMFSALALPASSTGGITKSGLGIWYLNSANSYTGATTVSAGVLQLGIASAISSSSNLILSGGTLSSGGLGFTNTFGTLTVSAGSTINLGPASHTLTFSNATLSAPLTVTGWLGTGGVSGTGGKLVINTSITSQLGSISFTGYTGATQLGTKEIVPTSGSGSGNIYYSISAGGNPASLSNWTTSSSGTGGTAPTTFGNATDLFIAQNNMTTIASGSFTIAGTLEITANTFTVSQGQTLTVKNIIVAGGTLTLDNNNSGGAIIVSSGGSWTFNSGTINCNTNAANIVTFTEGSTINGPLGTTFNILTIQASTSTGVATLNTSNCVIRDGGTINLTRGLFKLGSNSLTMTKALTLNGNGSNSGANTGDLAHGGDGAGDADADGGTISFIGSSGAADNVNGSVTFYNISNSTNPNPGGTGVDGDGNLVLTLANTCRINGTFFIKNSNSFIVKTTSPTWGPSSTLYDYASGQWNYANISPLWNAAPSSGNQIGVTAGYPNNVTLVNNNNNSGAISHDIPINGKLTIGDFTGSPSPLSFSGGTAGDFVCGGFIMNGGASVTAAATNMTVNGKFIINGGTFNNNSSKITMAGSGTSSNPDSIKMITGTLSSLTINNTAYVKLYTPVTVSGIFTLPTSGSSGMLETDATNILSVTNTTITSNVGVGITGGSSSSYINGPVNWSLPGGLATGNTFNFPVGSGTSTYLPFSLVNPVESNASIVTVQANNQPSNGQVSIPNLVYALSNTEYWSMSQTGGPFTTAPGISVSRPTTISPYNAVATSSTANGVYTNLDGTVSTNSVTGSDPIGTTSPWFFDISSKTVLGPSAVTLSTLDPSNPTTYGSTSATLSGTVNANGTSTTPFFNYGTSSSSYAFSNITATPNPVTGSTPTVISLPISVSSNTVYYYQAGGTNTNSATNTGSQQSFTTLPDPPVLGSVANITPTGFTASWSAPGGTATISYYTIEYSINSDLSSPTVVPTNITTTSYSFTTLSSGTTYYFAVKAVNAGGAGAFSTVSSPITTAAATAPIMGATNAVTNILVPSSNTATATSGGSVASTGGNTIIAEGVAWSTTSGGEIAGSGSNYTSDGTATPFTSLLTGLSASTTYYVKDYATNGIGTSYGSEQIFTTYAVEPNSVGSVSIGNLQNNSFNITFTPGNGSNRLIVVRTTIGTSDVPPTDGTDGSSFTANPTYGAGGGGSTTGAGNYVVYNSTGSGTITVSGLTQGTQYTVSVYEYNGTGVFTNYLTTGFATTSATTTTPFVTYYNLTSATNANLTASWTTDPTGTTTSGFASPTGFTPATGGSAGGDQFIIRAGTAMSLSAAWSLAGPTTGNNFCQLFINGTLNANNFNITIGGAFTNNGTFNNQGTGSPGQTVSFGTGGSIGGTAATTFRNLTISTTNNTDVVTLLTSGASIVNNSGGGTLTFSKGIFKIGSANTLFLNNSNSPTGIVNSNTTDGTSDFAHLGDGAGDADADGGTVTMTGGGGSTLSATINAASKIRFYNLSSNTSGTSLGIVNAGTVVINGTLTSAGSGGGNGVTFGTNSPIYGINSLLSINNNGQGYTVGGLEWKATSGFGMTPTTGTSILTPAGYPNNVTIVNCGTSSSPTYNSINIGAQITSNFSINGTLSIGTSSASCALGLNSSTFYCGNLVIDNGSILSATSNFTVKGNWRRQGSTIGTFTPGTNTVIFGGSGTSVSPQTISLSSGTESSFFNLTINNGTYVTLNSPVTLPATGVLTLTSGVLDATTNLLTIQNTNNTGIGLGTNGGSTTNHINGQVAWNTNGTSGTVYTFPLGSGTNNYLPLILTKNTTTTPTVTAQAFAAGSYTGVGDGTTLSVNGLSDGEYWSLSSTASLATSTVGLSRTAGLSTFNAVGESTTSGGSGTYSSVGGAIAGSTITSGDIGSGTSLFLQLGTKQILGTITTGTITGSPFCQGASVSVPFVFTPNGFGTPSTFTAQISNDGFVSSITTIGTGSSSPISATIPSNAINGNNYSIRVISTSPAVTGSDNGANLTVAGQGLTLMSAAGTIAQVLCANTAITPITYSVANATNVTVSGLPTNVTGSYNSGTHVFTISGTPNVTGAFTYTVTTTGTSCSSAVATGTINVGTFINLSSGTNGQTVCQNNAINNIIYSVGGEATGASITSGALPSGVTGIYGAGVFTISGTPVLAGTYNYTIATSGGSCTQATINGTINVNGPILYSVPAAPIIRYDFTGGSYNDIGSDANPASPQGSPTTTTDRFGNSGNAFALTASSNQYFTNTNGINVSNFINGGTTTNVVPFSASVWFNTSTSGMLGLMEITDVPTATPGNYDHALFMSSGFLFYGTYNSGNHLIVSTAAYNDGKWHNAVVTMGSSDGTILYVDGINVTGTTGSTMTSTNSGNANYWRIGYTHLGGWSPTSVTDKSSVSHSYTAGGPYYFNGSIDDAVLYNIELSSTQVAALAAMPSATANTSTICTGSNEVINLTSSLLAAGTYTVAYNVTGANSVNTTASMTIASNGAGGSFAIPGANLGAPGTNTVNITGLTINGCASNVSLSTTFTTSAASFSASPSTATPSYCLNVAATPLSVTVAAGSGTITQYQWFSNASPLNSGGTLVATHASSSTTDTYTPLTTSTGALYYYCIVSNSTGCTATSALSGLITVNPNSTVTLTSANGTDAQTVNSSAPIVNITYSVTTSTGATVSGLPSGISGSYSAGVVTISGSSTEAGTYNYTVTPIGGCGTATGTGQIIINNTCNWKGPANGDWNDPNNWTCGVPSITADVTIPSSSSPVLSTDVTVGSLSIGSGSTVSINGNTLTVNGPISGSGVLSGSLTSNLSFQPNSGSSTISFDQSADGSSNALSNLTVNGNGTMVLGNKLNIYSDLNVSEGTLDLNGVNVVIKSNINGTASVDQIQGTLLNATNVTVESYIPANDERAWRLLAVPTGGGQTINAAWQEGQTGETNNGQPGYGTIITAGTANSDWASKGFDAQQVSGSMLTYDQAHNSWDEVPSTFDALATTAGYFLYIRGDRSQLPSPDPGPTTATTLRSTGTLYQGPQTVSVPPGAFALIGNVYASAVDFSAMAVDQPGIDDVFYVWDPKLLNTPPSLGAYVTFSASNGWVPEPSDPENPGLGSYGITPNSLIASGQAFFVHANSGGNVTMDESSKVDAILNVFRPASPVTTSGKLTTNLYEVSGSTSQFADGNVEVFNSAYSDAVDGNDALKLSNTVENFGIIRNGKVLEVEARQPVSVTDTVYFDMWNMKQQQYRLGFTPLNLNTGGLTAYLADNYLGTKTAVDLTTGSSVLFSVDGNAGSSASNRFAVVFSNPSTPVPVTFTGISAKEEGTSVVAVSWQVSVQDGITGYEVERSTDGVSFTALGTVAAKGGSGSISYSWTDNSAPSGTDYYRVKGISGSGATAYTSIVPVAVGSDVTPGISVYPNPVTDGHISLSLNNQAAGSYEVRLLDVAGQAVYITSVSYSGDGTAVGLDVPGKLAAGVYRLEVVSPAKVVYSAKVVIK